MGHSIATVWWWMFGVATVVMFGVLLLAGAAFWRRRDAVPLSDRGARSMIIAGGIALPTVAIVALLIYGLPAGQGMRMGFGESAYQVDVRAHQWWWEVSYPDAPGGVVYAANEIHIPAGRAVTLNITSNDVIHSFWVPRLGGKIDAIPGRTNVLHLKADDAGQYAGVCAEFCGAQHARMGFFVTAHAPDALDGVLAGLAQPHPNTQRLADHTGYQQQCAACHSLDPRDRAPSGVSAGLATGPNLAGLGAREYIGAGALLNTPEHLKQWMREHQVIKPGNHMPVSDLPRETLDELAELLGATND